MTALPIIPLYNAAAAVISKSGLAQICAPFTGGVGTIFTLHRVQPAAPERAFQPNHHLSVTPEFLDRALSRVKKAGFDVVSLSETIKRLKSGRRDRPFCTFTFDDGYQDNIDLALPVFQKHGAPMTVFVCTDVIDGKAVLWWEILEAVLAANESVDFETADGFLHFDTATAAGKSQAAKSIEGHFRSVPREEDAREQMLQFARTYKVDAQEICRSMGARWQTLKKAVKDPLFHVGAHTITHPILSRLPAEQARSEMVESRSRIQSELDVYVEHFAYPYGGDTVCGKREFDMVAELGFKSGVTTMPGVLVGDHGHAPWALPRASLNGHYQNDAMIDSLISGVAFFIANGFRRSRALI